MLSDILIYNSLIDDVIKTNSQLYLQDRSIQGCTYDATSHPAHSRLCFRCITPPSCRESANVFLLPPYARHSSTQETHPTPSIDPNCTALPQHARHGTHETSSSSSRRAPNPSSSATSPPIPSQPPIYPQMPFNPQHDEFLLAPQPQTSSPPSRKRKAPGTTTMTGALSSPMTELGGPGGGVEQSEPFGGTAAPAPAPKKSRTNTPWSPAEEQRLKTMRDAGSSWGEIAKVKKVRDEPTR